MKKIFTFLFALLFSVSVFAQYDQSQKYGLWSNWTAGANIEIVESNADGFNGGIGLDLQFTKQLANHWAIRFTGSAPVIYKVDTLFNRYALAAVGVMYFPFNNKFYVAGDAGVGTFMDGEFHAYFTPSASTGYRFIIKDKHIINAELGVNYRHTTKNFAGGPDYFARIGYAYSLGLTKTDRAIIDQKAQILRNYITNETECIELNRVHNETLEKLERLDSVYNMQIVTINYLWDSIETLNTTIDSLWMMIEEMTDYDSAPTVMFTCNSSNISRDQYPYLDYMASMCKNTDNNIVVYGFADSQSGTLDYNNQLSQKRADALKDALVRRGIKKDRIKAIGQGCNVRTGDSNSAASRRAILIFVEE